MKVYYFSQMWGNSVGATWETKQESITTGFQVSGCQRKIPDEDDYLIGECNRNILLYKLSNIKRSNNPHDLFFADAKFINGFNDEDMKSIDIIKCDHNQELYKIIKQYEYGSAGLCYA